MKHCCPGCHYKKLYRHWKSGHWGYRCQRCKLEIYRSDRDAEISDHFTVLDKMVMTPQEEFLAWWRSVHSAASRTGLEVLHQTEFLTVFKNQESKTSTIDAFFNARRVEDKIDDCGLDYKIWDHQATDDLKFRGERVKEIVNQHSPLFQIFPSDAFPDERITKKVKAATVEWARAFEAAYPALKAKGKELIKLWKANQEEDAKAVHDCLHVCADTYNGFERSWRLRITRRVSPAAILAIDKIVENDQTADLNPLEGWSPEAGSMNRPSTGA